jgi:hypothetical protein
MRQFVKRTKSERRKPLNADVNIETDLDNLFRVAIEINGQHSPSLLHGIEDDDYDNGTKQEMEEKVSSGLESIWMMMDNDAKQENKARVSIGILSFDE